MKEIFIRYVFKNKYSGNIDYLVESLSVIENGYIKKYIEKEKDGGWELISKDLFTNLHDKRNEKMIFENDRLYDPVYDSYGIVKYLEETAVWIVDWDDDCREDLFDALDNSERNIHKKGTKYEDG